VTSPEPPSSVRPVEYKGEPLDSARGPGLGCFRFQVVVLAIFVIITPIGVAAGWPIEITGPLLFAIILLLLLTGQTIIFLLRLVAADRREGRRVPLASSSKTVGELEERAAPGAAAEDSDENATPSPDPGVQE
jgi:hypothetical protein